ncbi:hypothetical protein RRG08_017176 [Elysia crispata]|uniref:Uncharacterized protein n=1 Tax=Elysia crispata TaxID=231223 RepID=A0AAE1B3I7_9GAST|nr:hypothetical protein RRG08_017176 [Elysia crispata]
MSVPGHRLWREIVSMKIHFITLSWNDRQLNSHGKILLLPVIAALAPPGVLTELADGKLEILRKVVRSGHWPNKSSLSGRRVTLLRGFPIMAATTQALSSSEDGESIVYCVTWDRPLADIQPEAA